MASTARAGDTLPPTGPTRVAGSSPEPASPPVPLRPAPVDRQPDVALSRARRVPLGDPAAPTPGWWLAPPSQVQAPPAPHSPAGEPRPTRPDAGAAREPLPAVLPQALWPALPPRPPVVLAPADPLPGLRRQSRLAAEQAAT